MAAGILAISSSFQAAGRKKGRKHAGIDNQQFLPPLLALVFFSFFPSVQKSQSVRIYPFLLSVLIANCTYQVIHLN